MPGRARAEIIDQVVSNHRANEFYDRLNEIFKLFTGLGRDRWPAPSRAPAAVGSGYVPPFVFVVFERTRVQRRRQPVQHHLLGIENAERRFEHLEIADVLHHRAGQLDDHLVGNVGAGDERRHDAEGGDVAFGRLVGAVRVLREGQA